jgi:hypothetical protein
LTWPVAEHHEWIDAKLANWESGVDKKKGRFLVGSGPGRYYKPLEHATGLFRNFAEIDGTEAAFQQFANGSGMLGVSCMVARRKGDEIIGDAEPFAQWAEEHLFIRRAVRLWTAIQSYSLGQQGELRALIKWQDHHSVSYQDGGAKEWIATPDVYSELIGDRLKFPDIEMPAWYQLQRVIDRKLKQLRPAPQLLWDNGQLRLFVRPQSLIGAMWLQLALAVEGDRKYRTCVGCGRWFEIGGGQKRADSETCNATCRKRRQRKGKP